MRMVAAYGDVLRYCQPWKSWLCWDGRRWKRDDTLHATLLATRTLLDEAKAAAKRIAWAMEELATDPDNDALKRAVVEAKELIAWLVKSQSAKCINAMLDLARSRPGIPILPADLDRDPFLFNVLKGTLDLRTGELRPHRQEDFLTKLAPVEFDPKAECPLWLKFLGRIMDGNADLITYLKRLVGHGLTGDVSEQSLWFFTARVRTENRRSSALSCR
jgi:putative DNA primase/helicase